MELNGVTALVTGGADGIGAGIAERLAAEGMHVVIADLDDRQGPILAERIGGWSTTREEPRSRISRWRIWRGGTARST
jgi:NAD(P)-dependent dehydrogenase (short-subunit alcohol dehydrogenase family)